MPDQFLLKWLFIIIFCLVFFVLYIRWVESRSVFFPGVRSSTATPADAGLEFENIFFKTSDGLTLHGWLVPAREKAISGITFLFFHGNAGSVSDRLGKIQLLHQLGVSVFVIDYRGYGKSEGKPSEQGIYLDARTAYDYLAGRKDLGEQKIIAYGVSLGGAPAVDLAVNRPVDGLIIESTLTSAKEMARKILPIAPSFLIQTKLDSITKITEVNIPKLIIHSLEDEMIPFEMGRRLFEAGPEPKEFLEIRGMHNEGFSISGVDLVDGMNRFLDKYFR